MKNYKQHIDDITVDFDNTMFKEYHAGQWGIEDGYRTDALYLARLKYTIAKWQYDYDCTGELCIKSRGRIVSNCCRAGQTTLVYTSLSNCCSPPSAVNPADGLCYFPGSLTPFSSTPCLYCPTGYTLNPSTGICVGPNGELANLQQPGTYCVNTTNGDVFGSPSQPCPGLVTDSTVVSVAGGFGTSPFPQIGDHNCCRDDFKHHDLFGDLL